MPSAYCELRKSVCQGIDFSIQNNEIHSIFYTGTSNFRSEDERSYFFFMV